MNTNRISKYSAQSTNPARAPSSANANENSRPNALQELVDMLQEPFQEICDSCDGLGTNRLNDPCKVCNGTGKVLNHLI